MRQILTQVAVLLGLSLVLAACTTDAPAPAPPVQEQRLARFENALTAKNKVGESTPKVVTSIKINGKVVFEGLTHSSYTPYFPLVAGHNDVAISVNGLGTLTKSIDNAPVGKNTTYLYGQPGELLAAIYTEPAIAVNNDTTKSSYRVINLFYSQGTPLLVSPILLTRCPAQGASNLSLSPDEEKSLIELATIPYAQAPLVVDYAPTPQSSAGKYDLFSRGADGFYACVEVNGADTLGKLSTLLLVDNGSTVNGGSVVIVKD